MSSKFNRPCRTPSRPPTVFPWIHSGRWCHQPFPPLITCLVHYHYVPGWKPLWDVAGRVELTYKIAPPRYEGSLLNVADRLDVLWNEIIPNTLWRLQLIPVVPGWSYAPASKDFGPPFDFSRLRLFVNAWDAIETNAHALFRCRQP